MTIIHVIGIPEQYRNDVMSLLVQSDKEFVPSLSSRIGSSQTVFDGSVAQEAKPVRYFNTLCTQSNLLIVADRHVIGIMSFKHDCRYASVPMDMPNVYMSTLIISPKYRDRGLARALYERLFYDCESCHVFTRTWSTNQFHIQLLKKLGFHEHLRIANDRGVGIDTVYYHKNPVFCSTDNK